jgi:hypothetical protein
VNAAVIDAFDRPPRYDSFSDPVAAEGEKLIVVTAAGLHPVVKALASGTHLRQNWTIAIRPGSRRSGPA